MANFDSGRAPLQERLNQNVRTFGVSDWPESDTLETELGSKVQHLMAQDVRVEHQLDDAKSQPSSMRRPRAGTMPAQTTIYPYIPNDGENETERLNAAAAATSQRSSLSSSALPLPFPPALGNSAFDVWGPEPGVQSPTTPTTDQLLKEDKANTIASTLASLGLDDDRDRPPVLHSRHSYTSLNTLNRCSDWSRPHRPEASEQTWRRVTPDTMPFLPMQRSTAASTTTDGSAFMTNDGFLPVPNLATSKLQLPTVGRPRAISMTVADNWHASSLASQSSAAVQAHGCLPNPYYSIWNPSTSMRRQHFQQDQSRPSLRTSNSSADLLEMIARQKRTATSPSPLPVYATLPAERDVSPFNISGSSLEIPSYNGLESEPLVGSSSKGSPASIPAQVPTRSLWLGNIDPSLSNADLNEIFRRYGPIENVRVLPDRECAFVNFMNLEDALRAKDALIHQLGCKLGNTLVKVGFGKPDSVPHQTLGDFGNTQEPTRALWIGNIPSTTTTASLYTIFSPYGPIESVRVLTHKNCGFVNFETLEDAQRARKALHGKDVMGAGTGPLRIGFAKVPSKTGNMTTADTHDDMDLDLTKGWTPSSQKEDYQTQMLMYMMAEMMGDASANIFTAVATERKQIMEELGEDDSDGPLFDQMHIPLTYYSQIPAAPELGQTRKVDISRLRDIRKRLDTGGYVATAELEAVAIDCLDEIVELCSDYIGNTVIQRLFERCSEATKTKMTQAVAPHLASIGIHKNGTWAAQKIIETAKLPANIDLLCSSIKLYVPALLLDQFGNYVVQCCLGLGPERNQFIFDAIVDNCWEIAKGRFGARAVRATLESPHVTKRQQKYVAATIVQHALMLATNTNGALLLIWLLDTSGIPGRYRVLALRLCPHLAKLCTHKLASLTVLKIVNQRQEPDARKLIIDTLVFSHSDEIINEVLMDQVHGVNLIQKILSSSYVELSERQRIAERIKQLLHKLRLQHVQGYKRLLEEINMVMGDSNPGESLGALPGIVPPSFAMNPDFAAALQAKYFAAAAAAAAAGSKPTAQSTLQSSSLPAYFNLPTTNSSSSPSTPDAQPKSNE